MERPTRSITQLVNVIDDKVGNMRLRVIFSTAVVAASVGACGGRTDNDALDASPLPDGALRDAPNDAPLSASLDAGVCTTVVESRDWNGRVSRVQTTCEYAKDSASLSAKCDALCECTTCSPAGLFVACMRDPAAETVPGLYVVNCAYGSVGRLPAGFSLSCERPTTLAQWLSQTATLEAVAVHAFAVMHDELRMHGAPQSLLDRVQRAERDEVRHAKLFTHLLEAHGGTFAVPHVAKVGPRPLVAIAIENAVEGAVRETYAALLATWQAQHAQSATLRATLRGVARDETQHAELSWDVMAWLDTKLTAQEREQVSAAMKDVVSSLARQEPLSPALRRELGLPDGREARALQQSLFEQLWGAPLAA